MPLGSRDEVGENVDVIDLHDFYSNTVFLNILAVKRCE